MNYKSLTTLEYNKIIETIEKYLASEEFKKFSSESFAARDL